MNEPGVWTKEWPTEPGWYWFYGHLYGEDRDSEYGIVRVYEISNGVMRTIDGQFMYEADGHDGIFTKAILPLVPGIHQPKQPK